jgi:protein phosphatase 1 regulatory subunit 11
MASSAQQTPQTAPATSGSATTTTNEAGPSVSLPSGTLRLRGQRTDSGRHIQWAEDVIDNEGMGKKSSKGT